MSKTNQITNAGALKLQHASAAQLQTRAATVTGANTGKNTSTQVQFADILHKEADKAQSVQFSKHAAQRVQQRGIQMTDTLLDSINQAVGKAREKGAKDVVIIRSQAAFIVNVTNNTVITSMSGAEMRDNIFTNIDSAVLV